MVAIRMALFRHHDDCRLSRTRCLLKPKTPVQGGGGLRPRWRDAKGRTYEWDKRHGTVEVYDKTGKRHRGEFDPVNGKRLGPADPRRKVEP
jgi:Cytotoxic